MDVPSPDIDPNFEPQIRARSNTWPLRPKEFVKEEDQVRTPTQEEKEDSTQRDLGLNKKTSSRRNAWGNMSYADLITKAIQSSAEQRLTLSQIYEWMVQNVPYFKDKGDSNSSAGWKVSFRLIYTLYTCIKSVGNCDSGLSSWMVAEPVLSTGVGGAACAPEQKPQDYCGHVCCRRCLCCVLDII